MMLPMDEIRGRWDFDDPAGSEARFREAATAADGVRRELLLTQVARALGLQERYEDGHALLDGLRADHREVAVRTALERGRLLRSAGDEAASAPHFDTAARLAAEAGLAGLQVDALHMAALVAPEDERVHLTSSALDVARASPDPEARRWAPSLLNNLGLAHADTGDFAAALDAFEEALELRLQAADTVATRVARWMVGWALRNLGRDEEALATMRALKAELDAVGAVDTYVDQELALLEADPSPS